MSSRDFVLSVVLHGLVIIVTVVSIPLAQKRSLPFGEVIRVQLTAASEMPGREPTPIITPQIPQAEPDQIPPEEPVIPPKPIEEPAVIPEPEKEPEKKPEKKPEPKPEPQQQPPDQTSQPAEDQPADEQTGGQSGGTAGDTQSEAPVGEGSPFGGATYDNPSFTYPWWFTQAFNKIASGYHVRQSFPPDITCVIYFEVIRSGRVIELRVEQPSGYPDFDDACMTAVSRATPFPPLPRDFVDEVIGITLPFKPSR